jgi:hypothetical protein
MATKQELQPDCNPRSDISVHLAFPTSRFGAGHFGGFVLGNGLGAFKLLPALLATILVGWHGSILWPIANRKKPI